ncbi:bifunctional DNA primase/polymerase [Streptomyces canus]|uniref:bifunctional DNA primase/polymerase n=1 Tax=Streptomyces canus TaxID=58343 RepID=UPI0039A47AEE
MSKIPGQGPRARGRHDPQAITHRVRHQGAQHAAQFIQVDGVGLERAGLVIDIDAHQTEPPARDRILPDIPIGDHIDLTGLANGFHTLAVLAALRGQQSPADDASTLRVHTPSGGLHVWYRATDNRPWKSSAGSSPGRALAWQVDIRAHGSYIIAPGTTTQQGTYTPVGDVREPAALPLWLAQELDRTGHLPAPHIPAPRPVPPRAQQAVLAAGGRRWERTLAAVLAPVEACGQVAEGAGFSDTLNRAAYTLGGLIAADRLDREVAEQALRQAAATRPGQELRIEQIIRSGLAAGLDKPARHREAPVTSPGNETLFDPEAVAAQIRAQTNAIPRPAQADTERPPGRARHPHGAAAGHPHRPRQRETVRAVGPSTEEDLAGTGGRAWHSRPLEFRL